MFLGQDYSTFLTDANGNVTRASMDLSFTPVGGDGTTDDAQAQVCRETVLRKLMCPPGSMDDPEWGIDLRTYLNANLRSDDLGSIAAVVRGEILKEEYVDECDVLCLLSADGSMIVDITLQLADLGVYTFAFSLSPEGIQTVLGVAGSAD